MVLASELRTAQPIDVDLARPRVIGVFGKRNAGKTNTLLRLVDAAQREGNLVLIVDTLGLIHPQPHTRLYFGHSPTPGRTTTARCLQLDPTSLYPDLWLSLFDLKATSPMGITLHRALVALNAQQRWWSVGELMTQILIDERSNERTRQALESRLQWLAGWGLFAQAPAEPLAVLSHEQINVLDLRTQGQGSRNLYRIALRLLAERLFQVRMAMRHGEVQAMTPTIPPVLLAIDEGHSLTEGSDAAGFNATLITYAKEGRHPQVSLLVATQQPSTLAAEVLSQCDLLIVHHLSHGDDIRAAGRLAGAYAPDMAIWMKAIHNPGDAIIIDDLAERAWVGHVHATPIGQNTEETG